ncbi:MAG: sigma-70 family RNA polymerase sigma factor [Oscillospiraceae bacterium]|nr:sigma-70 family RNA polymerase sigma factor [Oscillospiraceae bacterium]
MSDITMTTQTTPAVDFSPEDIYRQYRRKVLGYISSRISSWEDAEDLCEEVFVKLFKAMERFDAKQAKPSTLLYKLAHDIVIDYYRTHKEHGELNEGSATVSGADDIVGSSMRLDELKEALLQLPEEQRDIIVLRYYKGITLLKISEMMGMSYKMVKYRHSQALEAMKKLLV